MTNDNQVVHGLWIGDKLSPLELLCIKSFQSHGHVFHLWTYADITTPLPEGTIIRSAEEIIPLSKVFSYEHGNEFGHGKGSLAGFSDIFRYKLLFDHGGWWTDMDVTCLYPLDFSSTYVFRRHDVLAAVGNLMKCPKGSPVMKWCYETANHAVNAQNTDWLLPIRILNEGIVKYNLESLILDISNPDRWEIVDCFREQLLKPDPDWYVFHWMNEEWRSKRLDKAEARSKSYLSALYQTYDIKVRYLPPTPIHTRLSQLLLKQLTPLIPQFIRRKLKSLFIRAGKLFTLT